jgi:hypothetical protein
MQLSFIGAESKKILGRNDNMNYFCKNCVVSNSYVHVWGETVNEELLKLESQVKEVELIVIFCVPCPRCITWICDGGVMSYLSILSHVSSPELICLMTINKKLWVQFHFDSYWLYITPSLHEAHAEPAQFLKSSSLYKNLYITWYTHLSRSFHLKHLWCRAYLTEWKKK